jgi:hypothetical protein
MSTVLTKMFSQCLSNFFTFSKKTQLDGEFWVSNFTKCTLEIVECHNELCVRDAPPLAARNPDFPPFCLIFNHNKLMVIEKNCNLLFKGTSKINDRLDELSENKCFLCLWIMQVN